MKRVQAYEGREGRLYSNEFEAVASVLAGPSAAAQEDFYQAVKGLSAGSKMSVEATRIRAAILVAAKLIAKVKS